MIQFNYETNFELTNETVVEDWLHVCIHSYQKEVGDINYIFCDDDYLLDINKRFLNHDTLTDIISFDYSDDKFISGDIFISIDRVKDNAEIFSQTFENELFRVIIHGVLHFIGFKDKSEQDEKEMRVQEDKCLNLF